MSTLISHEVCRIESLSDFSTNSVQEVYESAMSSAKSGVILNFRNCKDFSKLSNFVDIWVCSVGVDFQIICLFNFEQLKKLPQINSNRVEIAILVDNAQQILDRIFERRLWNLNLVIQAQSKKELLEILQNQACQSVLKQFEHSFLPNLDIKARFRFTAKEYFDLVKKFEIKRDYRFPLAIEDNSNWNFQIKVVRHQIGEMHAPEISIVVPHNQDYLRIKNTTDSLLNSAQQTNTSIEIIAVGNNFMDSEKNRDLFIAGHARNKGAQLASAPNICFVDSDIAVGRDFFKHLKEGLQKQNVIQFKRFYGQHELILEPSYWSHFYNAKNWSDLKNFWRYTCTYALAMKKEIFFRSGQFQIHYLTYGFEDVDLGYRISKITKQFHLSDQKVIHPEVPKERVEILYRLKRFRKLSLSASLFFLDHLDYEVGYLVRNFLRWEHFKARVSLCNVFFQDKYQGN